MRIIGRKFTAKERAVAVAAARDCMGIAWRHMGRQGLPWGHDVGLDCIGLVMRAVVAAGRPVRDLAAYGRDPDGTLLQRMDDHLGARVASYGPACVLAIRFGGQPRHVALLTEANTLIHCYDGGPRKVVEHVFDDAWRKRVVAGWQL